MTEILLLISGLVLLAALLLLLASGFCLWRVHVLGSWLLEDGEKEEVQL